MRTSTSPHVDLAEGYVDDILNGIIPANKWIRLACERHRKDLEKSKSKDWPYKFDAAKAEKACKFFELMPHVKGKWARGSVQLLRLEPWQAFLVCSLFGWVLKSNGRRRFRKLRLYVARKNGKSTAIAPIGLFMLTADGEAGAEVYSGATNEKQAWEVFGPARQMTLKTPKLIEAFGVSVNAKSLTILDTMAKFEPIIGNPGDGSSPHMSITDEYHEHRTDDQLATMETGMGARDQPLSAVISTAGADIGSPCREDWLECQKVLEGVTQDDTLFALIYCADADDDWTSEVAMRKANPNLDVSVSMEFLQSQLAEAIRNPRKASHFKTKHLNLWVQARDAYINLQKWRECHRADLKLENLKGRRVWLGMDLASKVDIAAIEILVELDDGCFARFGKYYLPEATVEQSDGNGQLYRKWRDMGLITVTDGNMIDFEQIEEDLLEICKDHSVQAIGYDPFQATMLVTRLQSLGLNLVEYRQTVLNFSEPMKHVDALIREKKLLHDGDPVCEWSMSNVTAKVDRKDNVFPNKERDENKIDPFVALVMSMGLALNDESPGESIYERRGIRTI